MIARRLGPDPLLVEALTGRLAEVGWTGGPARLVLVAAGSSFPAARQDVADVAQLVSARFARPVAVGYAATEPAVDDVVAQARLTGEGPVVVLNYLLSPGQFADKVGRCGADLVAGPLGAHPAVARLVLERYDAAVTAAVPAVPVS
jgi:sirohydrochlorin ferrochelatase